MGMVRGSDRMCRMLLILTTPSILIFLSSLQSAQSSNVVGRVVEQDHQLVRNPKVFFPLTTSTATATTTPVLATTCYYTTATLVACKKRKKRMVTNMIEGLDKESDIIPSTSVVSHDDEWSQKKRSQRLTASAEMTWMRTWSLVLGMQS